MVALAASVSGSRSRNWHEFTAETFEVRSRSGKAFAGVDGEALEMDTPLRVQDPPARPAPPRSRGEPRGRRAPPVAGRQPPRAPPRRHRLESSSSGAGFMRFDVMTAGGALLYSSHQRSNSPRTEVGGHVRRRGRPCPRLEQEMSVAAAAQRLREVADGWRPVPSNWAVTP